MRTFQRPQPLGTEVYEHLRDEVLTGGLQPGQWLREQELAATLQVSRTPIREAVRRLVQEGLLELEANRGVRVRELTAQEAVDTYEVRERLETMAAQLAAARADRDALRPLRDTLAVMEELPATDYAAQIKADDAFHLSIAKLSGNEALFDVIRLLNGRITRVKILTRDTNSSETTRVQHRAIVEAIAAGDPERAEAAMREHIRTYRELVRKRMQPKEG